MTDWERFSEPAKRVVLFAQEEAWRAGWKEIQPIYFFSAILRDRECHAANALKVSGVRWEKFQEILSVNIPRPDVANIQKHNIEEMVLSSESVSYFKISYKHYINIWKNLQFNTAYLLLGLLDIHIMNQYGLSSLDFHERNVRQEAKRLRYFDEIDHLRDREDR